MNAAPELIADGLVNIFAALGTTVIAYNLKQADPHGSLTRRAVYALLLVSALFLTRCAAWVIGSGFLLRLADIMAALTPLMGLLVVEGLLRRHASRAAKLTIVAGSSTVALVSLIPGVSDTVFGATQLACVGGGFALLWILLWTQNTVDLSTRENEAIRRTVIAMAMLVPLIATDFRSLWPDVPVRLGAVGVLLVLYFAFGPGRSSNTEKAVSLAAFAAISCMFAFGYVSTRQSGDVVMFLRVFAVGLCGLIFAALWSAALGARAERRQPVDPLLSAGNAAEFATALKEHRLLGNCAVLDEEELRPLRQPDFDILVMDRAVLRRSEAPWHREKTDDGVERAMSLLATYDASHVMRLSGRPMTLAIFSLPQISADERMESEIVAAQRIGEALFAGAAR